MSKLIMSIFAAIAATSLVGSLLIADDEPQGSLIMKRKLEYSQNVLAGLAAGDFEMIAKNARILRTYTQLENHLRGKDPKYRTQLDVYWFANDELIRLSEEKNIEGASLAFTQLTQSCVNCHVVLRDQKE